MDIYDQFEEAIRYANRLSLATPHTPESASYRTRPSYGTRAPLYETTLNRPTDHSSSSKPRQYPAMIRPKPSSPPTAESQVWTKNGGPLPTARQVDYSPTMKPPPAQVKGREDKLPDDGVPLHVGERQRAIDASLRDGDTEPALRKQLDDLPAFLRPFGKLGLWWMKKTGQVGKPKKKTDEPKKSHPPTTGPYSPYSYFPHKPDDHVH